MTITLMDYILSAATILIGIALLMHIGKEPKDAHGKARK